MDLASTLMGLGLLLLFVAPVGFLVYHQSNQEKKRAKKLAFLAGEKGYNLDEIENFHDLSLALDKTAKKFILLRSGEEPKLQVIDLNDTIKIESQKTDEDGKSTSLLDEMREIFLLVKSINHSDRKLVFYAEEEDPVTQKAERLERAIYWERTLQKYSHS